ncbi:MAG: chloride channel protein [Anaerolineae bacterium]
MLAQMEWREQRAFWRLLIKWLVLGGAVGVLSGTASAIFLAALKTVTDFRVENSVIVWLLPLAGLALGWVYTQYAGRASGGNSLVIEETHLNRAPIPRRMAPFVLIGTVWTHLFGGSAGREGTAIQMGASLADGLRRVLRLEGEDRRLMVLAGIAGGFGSVFGTPVAGFVFALEVPMLGRVRYEGLIPCLVASVVGDMVTRGMGIGHSHYPLLAETALDPLLLVKVLLAGVVCGLTALLFVEMTETIKALHRRYVPYAPLRPLIGGVVVVVLMLLVGTRDYLGLSLPLIQNTMNGTGVDTFAFLLKVTFTAVTLGSGFLGGEVTPLFVMGSTLGYTVGRVLGVDPAFMAALGFVAVFAGASNTPLACTMMGVELFGGGAVLYLAVACFVAYVASGHRGIYGTQRIGAPKTPDLVSLPEDTLHDVAQRRGNSNGHP